MASQPMMHHISILTEIKIAIAWVNVCEGIKQGFTLHGVCNRLKLPASSNMQYTGAAKLFIELFCSYFLNLNVRPRKRWYPNLLFGHCLCINIAT